MFHFVSVSALLVLFVAYVYIFVRDYRAIAPEDKRSLRDKLLALGSGSLTKLWLRLVSIAAVLVGQLANVAFLANMPETRAVLENWLQPETVAIAFIVIAIVGTWARDRSLPKDERTVL